MVCGGFLYFNFIEVSPILNLNFDNIWSYNVRFASFGCKDCNLILGILSYAFFGFNLEIIYVLNA